MHQIKARISGVYRIAQELKKYQTLCIQFFTYAFGMVLMRGITVLFAPITMFMLSPEDYGLLALANGFISIIAACLAWAYVKHCLFIIFNIPINLARSYCAL